MDIMWCIFQMQTKIKKIYSPQAYLEGKGAIKSHTPPPSFLVEEEWWEWYWVSWIDKKQYGMFHRHAFLCL